MKANCPEGRVITEVFGDEMIVLKIMATRESLSW